MDVITPARVWATSETDGAAAVPPGPHVPHGMALPQRAAMFAMVVIPLAGLLFAVAELWHRGRSGWAVGWADLLVGTAAYLLAGFGVTIGYHRLLTHRSFQTTRPMRLLLAVLGSSAGQGMTIRWCATHRRHHQQADLEGDPHSPHGHGEGLGGFLRGFWHAHMGWIFDRDKPGLARSVPDLMADRGLVLIDRLYFVWVAVGILLPAVALGWYRHSWQGFAGGLIWGGLVRICLMQHVTWAVNSVCHVWGARPFDSRDHSTNNLPVAVLSLGEGWHNNHHAFPTSARHGLRGWQFDPSYLLIVAFKRIGLAWDVRLPTAAAMAAKAARPAGAV